MGQVLGLCCPQKGEEEVYQENDGMISSKAKQEFEEILRERNANPVPLISGLNTTFKSAADIDSSSSIDADVMDEMLASTSSDDDDDDEEGMLVEESEDETE